MTAPKKMTAATVNAFLKSKGIKEKLTQGNGYCYFRDGDACTWPSSSVYTCYVTDMTIERWYEEYLYLKNRSF